jgi:hypothetical protein
MFPITDTQGKIIAFSGRLMPGTQEASVTQLENILTHQKQLFIINQQHYLGFLTQKKHYRIKNQQY